MTRDYIRVRTESARAASGRLPPALLVRLNMKILETQRLLLREFVPEDVDALAAVLSDPETMRYYPRLWIGQECCMDRTQPAALCR